MSDPSPPRRVLPLLVWVAALVASLVALLAVGHGHLATPPVHGFGRWVEAEGSIDAAIALARVAALVLTLWLLVSTAAAVGAQLLGRQPGPAVALPFVRRLVNGAVGVGIVVGAVTASGAAAYAAKPQAAAPTMVRLPGSSTPPELRMERLPDETAAPAPPPPAPPPPPPSPSPPTATPTATPATHTVIAGDHFWAVAVSTLTSSWGRTPTEAETVPYWRQLVEANRTTLADPGNPDLLFPNQVIAVPTPPPPPSS